MTAPVLMLGGYGSVGSRIIRMLRRLQPDVPMTIVGRDLPRAEDLANTIGNATARIVDLERADLGLPRDSDYSIVVTALRDLSLNTMRFAQTRRILESPSEKRSCESYPYSPCKHDAADLRHERASLLLRLALRLILA